MAVPDPAAPVTHDHILARMARVMAAVDAVDAEPDGHVEAGATARADSLRSGSPGGDDHAG
jgi:hypothetical protein